MRRRLAVFPPPLLLLLAVIFAAGPPAVAAAVAAPVAATDSAADGGDGAALVLHRGSVARRQLVALGRDLDLRGEALSDVAALNGSVRISGSVAGDVVVLGGNAHLAPTARVAGDVFALGGSVEAAPGAMIEGRTVSYPTASSAWLTLIEGPALGVQVGSPLVVGGKLALLAAWLALVLVFFSTAGSHVLSTSRDVAAEPLRNFLTGLVGVLALVLTALLFSAFAAALVGVPLLVLAVLLALVLKLWGMVAVFHALGDWLGRRLLRRPPRSLNAATLGLVVLGLLKFVPYVGIWVWSVATFIGVGAALATKFGSREPWFSAVPR